MKTKKVMPGEVDLPLDRFQQIEFSAGSTGRPRKHATNAEKQKAYRNRNRVTKCPYCQDSFFDVTGRVQYFSMLEQNGGRVYFCPGCNAYITLQAGKPTMWHVMIRPNLASIREGRA